MKFHAVILLPILAVFLAGCGDKAAESTTASTKTPETKGPDAKPAKPAGLEKLKVEDVKVGAGKQVAQDGDLLIMTYTGKLKSGDVFDSTDKHENKPFGFVLGQHQVIKGWDEGLKGMKIGGERKLSIPAADGYGDSDQGTIPPGSDLFFDVKLHAIVKKGEEDIYDKKEIKAGSGGVVVPGSKIELSYVMKYANGVEADKQKMSIKVGSGDILAAIEDGINGMREGGVRELILPPKLLQNSTSMGNKIPTQQVMVFDVKIEKVYN